MIVNGQCEMPLATPLSQPPAGGNRCAGCGWSVGAPPARDDERPVPCRAVSHDGTRALAASRSERPPWRPATTRRRPPQARGRTWKRATLMVTSAPWPSFVPAAGSCSMTSPGTEPSPATRSTLTVKPASSSAAASPEGSPMTSGTSTSGRPALTQYFTVCPPVSVPPALGSWCATCPAATVADRILRVSPSRPASASDRRASASSGRAVRVRPRAAAPGSPRGRPSPACRVHPSPVAAVPRRRCLRRRCTRGV